MAHNGIIGYFLGNDRKRSIIFARNKFRTSISLGKNRVAQSPKSTVSLDWICHNIHVIVVFSFLNCSNHCIVGPDNGFCERGFQKKGILSVS